MSDQHRDIVEGGVTAETAERMDYDPDDESTWDVPLYIENDGHADRIARKLAYNRQESARLRRRYEEEVAAAKQWLERELKAPERRIAFYEHHLSEYHRRQRPDGARYPLRHGTLTSRKGAEVVETEDEWAFIAWARENMPSLLRVKEEIDKQALKKVPAKDGRFVVEGEIVPGVSLVEKDRSWSVQTTDEEQPAWIPPSEPALSEGEAA